MKKSEFLYFFSEFSFVNPSQASFPPSFFFCQPYQPFFSLFSAFSAFFSIFSAIFSFFYIAFFGHFSIIFHHSRLFFSAVFRCFLSFFGHFSAAFLIFSQSFCDPRSESAVFPEFDFLGRKRFLRSMARPERLLREPPDKIRLRHPATATATVDATATATVGASVTATATATAGVGLEGALAQLGRDALKKRYKNGQKRGV
jgi:hypothetical protein